MRLIELFDGFDGFDGSFWNILGWFFAVFIFFAYLMVIFTVLGDLFRDEKLGGGAKAVWVIFLIFVPFITLLVYLIARGRGMNERSVQEATALKAAQDDYIKSVATGPAPAAQIAQAKGLLDSGAITQAEFDALKAKALA